MDCNEARALLDADVDRELSPPDALRVQQHVDECELCRRERERIVALSHAVRAADYHRAPDALRARIAALQPEGEVQAATAPMGDRTGPERTRDGGFGAPPQPQPRGRRRFSWLGWGVALVVALAAAGGIAVSAHRAETDRTVDELVASHVRAGLSARDIDVISTDRHTVKPWFNGRLDYAPPVEDLSANGFVLVGGRLDYVDRRRVAVLVYRYRQHVIDVYVSPAGDGRAAPYATVSQGYAVDRWTAAGMTWWAVTDAEPSALAAFRAALSARIGAADGEQ
ncbi:anti-sigma factor family protein [Burkholderia multivorans]|uniref:anti-sigma factor family protein n=1 Tax=Burkholderia multivorans TaxID=87883 RepID=UPI001C2154EA|nr:zf-HC2 domain-containing protein [Burkholderia multivorans]MBU9608013.1 zf-HC2 domain-containing protein [Burkholderia multivorans]